MRLAAIFPAVIFLHSALFAEPVYQMHDIGTFEFEKSMAKSLNGQGAVAGKIFKQDLCQDFVWSKETGLQILITDTFKEACPLINNLNQVAGVSMQRFNSWWYNDSPQIYLYDPQEGLKLLGLPYGWKSNKAYLVAFNDQSRIIISNEPDVFKATQFAVYRDGNFKLFHSRFPLFVSDLNNHNQHLVTSDDYFLFGLINFYLLQVFNQDTEEAITLSDGTLYYGLGLNDNYQVIARDRSGTKGYFWASEKEMIELDSLIPIALNNHGDILGSLEDIPCLRKFNGEIVNINASLTSSLPDFEKIIALSDINDDGQILAVAKIDGKEQPVLLYRP